MNKLLTKKLLFLFEFCSITITITTKYLWKKQIFSKGETRQGSLFFNTRVNSTLIQKDCVVNLCRLQCYFYLTFDSKPNLVIIAQGQDDSSGSAAIFISPATNAIANNRGGSYGIFLLQWIGNSIKWYCGNARIASDQYNGDNKIYLYTSFSL